MTLLAPILSARWIVPLITVSLAACAPSIQPAGLPVPEPWSAYEIETVAALLELEDRRRFDVEAISSASASPSPRVRARAALTAARTAPVDGRPYPRLLLADEDTSVAAAAAFAAGLARDTAAVERLVPLLDDAQRHPTVAIEAAAALGRIATPRAREVLRDLLLRTDTLSDGPVAGLVAEAILSTWRAGEDALEPFVRWSAHPDGEVRWRAAYALVRPYRSGAGATLRPLLDDSIPLVRAVALRSLALPAVISEGASRREALDILLPLLDDPAYQVRIEAIRALGTYDDAASIGRLADRLTGGSAHEIVAALEALARIGLPAVAAAPRLRQFLLDPATPSHVREQSVRALATIDPAGLRSLEDDLTRDPDWRLRSALASTIAPRRSEALPILRLLARDRDPRVAARTVAAMAESFDPETLAMARPLLIELLLAPDVHLRAAALDALSILADPVTFPALLDAYEVAQRDVENDAALSALDAIAALRTAGISPERAFFARFPRHGDYSVRLRAITLFGQAALSAWGSPLPIEVAKTQQTYRELVSRWLDASDAGPARPRAIILSESGLIEIELFAEAAPVTVSNFLELARIGYYDGQPWPRVVPNFVVQGGDPRGDTSGGPGYSIRDELNRHRFDTGAVGMALSGPDTGGSQFFLTHSPQPHLDGGYTVFGRVVDGQGSLEEILPGERILSVRIIDEGMDE